jgi:hypothetical protein
LTSIGNSEACGYGLILNILGVILAVAAVYLLMIPQLGIRTIGFGIRTFQNQYDYSDRVDHVRSNAGSHRGQERLVEPPDKIG